MKSRNTLAFILAFGLFLPDFDMFVLEKSDHLSLFESVFRFPIREKGDLLVQLFAILLFPLVVLNGDQILKNRRLSLIVAASAMCSLVVAISLFGSGYGLLGALRSPYMVNFFLFMGCAGIIGNLKDGDSTFMFGILGLISIGLLKVAQSLHQYILDGGVEFVQGVSSLAADGGVLSLWAFLVLACFCYASHFHELNRKRRAATFLILSGIFMAAVAMSFRRNVTIRMFFLVLGALLFQYWSRRELLKGVLISMSVVGVLISGVLVVMIGSFGMETTLERIRSLQVADNSDFAASNALYLDDWAGFFDAVKINLPIGTGFGQTYGIDRAHLVEGGTEPPFHTGSFEFWASAGFIGALFHILVLLAIPLKVSFETQGSLRRVHPMVVIGLVYTIYVALWPFGPPFHANPQSSILVGISLGLVGLAANLRGGPLKRDLKSRG